MWLKRLGGECGEAKNSFRSQLLNNLITKGALVIEKCHRLSFIVANYYYILLLIIVFSYCILNVKISIISVFSACKH